ncbi:NAD(P)/FAD-dependent oxidoreductase [Odoribacter sp. Z80]|uniref:NAD(P)/FAD-dependent oxidoreductase n=1 Tax=Odoribacter sp. Z80 TaxID=2304575 RepID=UPI00137A6B06|nr:NAD(P)/FAD-dependent oxidoreductase [Odoribacter sp. Z80]NCE72137.1 hypothetical protein [Odoribacter sp. Z80]
MKNKTAIIIGGGPAGLTSAYELLKRSDIHPIVLESYSMVGGISRTEYYKGNRMDMGGHRFFSKSDTIMSWWKDILPVEDQHHSPAQEEKLMLVRQRLSRIFFLRRFFNYPVSLSLNTIRNLGFVRLVKIGCSYIAIRLFPRKQEQSLEDFFINRFGKELYKTFFKDYTEKVWGIECNAISADWGAQRVKGLSVGKAIGHAFKSIFKHNRSIEQKDTETSLIEQFLYPKLGPGQLWEEVARQITEGGGEIRLNHTVKEIITEGRQVKGVKATGPDGSETILEGDYILSSMPIKDLIQSFNCPVPENIRKITDGLIYRDFMTVGLLLDKLKLKEKMVPDTWIYIQEREVKLGRLQIFNNWSPYMVADPDKIWIGLEYFVNEGDEMWNMENSKFIDFAIEELCRIDIIRREDVLDAHLIRVPKAYPAYFGSYKKLPEVIDYLSGFDNLYLMGRNGMHKYNNQDHSMLTAIAVVDCLTDPQKDKKEIWSINTEEAYHESK